MGDTKKKPPTLHRFMRDSSGAIAIYAAFTTMLLAGAGVLTIDYGRMVVLKNQLQNYADSAAAAGAVFLDHSPQAINNARQVVSNAFTKESGIFSGDGNRKLTIESINFYSSISPQKVTTTDPLEADFIEVRLEQHEVSFLMKPVLDMLSGDRSANSANLSAHAITSGTITACRVPPLMVCDYSEVLGSDYDILSSAAIGRQVKLIKESGTKTLAPGNFGILDTPDGSQASQEISEAMAAIDPPGCYGEDGTDTAPGVRAGPLADGINARFDLPSPPNNFGDPAPNVIHYPRDENMSSDVMGNGQWDYAAYWAAKHPDTPPPSALGNNPSRYQVYLYELNESFAVNGKQTLYPLTGALPAGFRLIQPSGSGSIPIIPCAVDNGEGKGKKGSSCDRHNPSLDGIPEQNPAITDPRRRVVEVVVLKCVKDNVKGNGGPYPNYGQFIEIFLTESVDSTHTIYGEVLRRITARNAEKLTSSIKYYE